MFKKLLVAGLVVGLIASAIYAGVYQEMTPNGTTGAYTITRILLMTDTAAGGKWRDRDTITSEAFSIEKIMRENEMTKPFYLWYGVSWTIDTGSILSSGTEADTTGDSLILELWSSMDAAMNRTKRVRADTIVPTAILTSKNISGVTDSAFGEYIYFKLIYLDSNDLTSGTNDTNEITFDGIDIYVR